MLFPIVDGCPLSLQRVMKQWIVKELIRNNNNKNTNYKMKKVLLSLLLAIASVPMAFGQSKAGSMVTVDTTVCGSFTWAVNNVTYTSDTIVIYTVGDTNYVLNLTMRAPSVNTADTAVASGNCYVNWQDSVWTVPGVHPYTIKGGASNHCDSVYYVRVNLVGIDTLDIDTASCGYYLAVWGDSLTTSTSFVDSTIITPDCQFQVTLNLTINPVYVDEVVEVTAGCAYEWHDILILSGDTNVYSDTLKTAELCDSVVSVRVTNFTNIEYDTVEIVFCDFYIDGNDTLTSDTTIITPDTVGTCVTNNVINLIVDHSYMDTLYVDTVDVYGGCSLEWMGNTYGYNDVDGVFFAVGATTAGECDSLMAIHIVSFDSVQIDTTTLDYCGVYIWKGDSLSTSGIYYDTVNNPTCTNITVLDLSIVSNHDTVTATACQSYTYSFVSRRGVAGIMDRETFYETGVYDTALSGEPLYSKHFSTKCITYHTLNLTIRVLEERYRSFVVDTTVCESYAFTFNNEARAFRQTIDTTLRAGIHTLRACYDSIGEFHVVVNNATYNISNVSACDSYYWPFTGQTYTSSTTVTKTLTDTVNRFGCDSIGKLQLTINKTPVVSISGNWNLQPGETANLKAVYDENDHPTFQWYKNEVPIPASQGGNTDSISVTETRNTDIHLETTSNKGCVANNWITVTYNVGIEEVEGLQVNIYPNPASRYLNVESEEGISRVVIYNAIGQQVISREVNSSAVQLDLGGLATGTYTMRLVSNSGEEATRKFIVNK